jgi:hypothetical protein
MGFIGRIKIPFSIDLGVGDVVVPLPVERTLPVILPEFEEPKILTYSLESTWQYHSIILFWISFNPTEPIQLVSSLMINQHTFEVS